MSPNILLLSIQHKYASMIFEGCKQVELRRVRPRHLENGDLILVYATSPERALVGLLEVEKVVEMSPDKLWRIVKDKAGITQETFEQYYKDSTTGSAIFLKKSFSFSSPIRLDQLRKKWLDFQPPQCYHYLKDKELQIIQSMTESDILSFSEKPKIYQRELAVQT